MSVLLDVGCSRPLAGLFNEKIRMLDGGALEIADVAGEDTATYICRAYNGIGDGATREYTLRVNSTYIPCSDIRVPMRTGRPGKMGRHFPVREKSGNFEQTGKIMENHTKYWKTQGI